jgi:hypothetical protein
MSAKADIPVETVNYFLILHNSQLNPMGLAHAMRSNGLLRQVAFNRHSADLLLDDNFTNIIELIPVFVERVHVPIQWLELGPTGDGHIQGFGGIFVEQIAHYCQTGR